jgi:hypothetical protein
MLISNLFVVVGSVRARKKVAAPVIETPALNVPAPS